MPAVSTNQTANILRLTKKFNKLPFLQSQGSIYFHKNLLNTKKTSCQSWSKTSYRIQIDMFP